jgi:hypothetical protein
MKNLRELKLTVYPLSLYIYKQKCQSNLMLKIYSPWDKVANALRKLDSLHLGRTTSTYPHVRSVWMVHNNKDLNLYSSFFFFSFFFFKDARYDIDNEQTTKFLRNQYMQAKHYIYKKWIVIFFVQIPIKVRSEIKKFFMINGFFL